MTVAAASEMKNLAQDRNTESWRVGTRRQGPEKLLGVVKKLGKDMAALFCGENPLIGVIAEEETAVINEEGALSEDMFC